VDRTAGVVFLSAARTEVERELVAAHLADSDGPDVRIVEFPRTAAQYADIGSLLDLDPELRLVPLSVLWRPAERGGTRRAGVTDVLRGVNPYKPSSRQQKAIVAREPDRARVVRGTSATLSELRDRWAEGEHGDAPGEFTRYVVRRGRVALERAERDVLGPTYKSPKLAAEEIFASARFQRGLAALRGPTGEPVATGEAETMLGEMATGWSRLVADLIPAMGRRTFNRGFDEEIDVIPAEIERLRATTSANPTVFLWSHRSNMDNPTFTITLHEQGIPMPHTFAGINMAFGPIPLIYRHAGVVFIRRNIGADVLYKYVLKEFVGYLVERRFNLSWSIEGTRSRTGKMLPPKLGLLHYAAQAYLEGRTDDITLQPVSMTFDQLHEIEEYAAYASGATKKKEGLRWALDYMRAQGSRHYGRAYVRFAEPVRMRAHLGPPGGEIARDPDAVHLALQKLAFEVAWRINESMPVTPTSLVTSILLGSRGRGLTLGQTLVALEDALASLERRGVPTARSLEGLRTPEGVREALETLASGGPVTAVREGREPVWLIAPRDQLAATFYRNSIIHVFLTSSICEISAVAAGRAADRGEDAVEEFWRTALRLRDLLKFEFYFRGRDDFTRDVEAEMRLLGDDWADVLGGGSDKVAGALSGRLPLTSPFTLRPFLESYAIVYDVLAHAPELPEKADVVTAALGLGEQYFAQGLVDTREPVSALLFETALQLAASEGLLEDGPDRRRLTREGHEELMHILRRISRVESIAEKAFADRHRRRSDRTTE
jgi:glycerol-3-phosphate O-acyltransferase